MDIWGWGWTGHGLAGTQAEGDGQDTICGLYRAVKDIVG